MRCCALALLLLLAGCAHPPPTRLGRSAELVVVDARPRIEALRAGSGWWYLAPVIPFYSIREDYHLQRTFVGELKAAVEELGLYDVVLTTDDPVALREAAPHRLRVVLEDTWQGLMHTTYLLGFPAIVLHLIGAPKSWASTSVILQVEAGPRAGPLRAKGRAEVVEVVPYWLFGGETERDREERLQRALRKALTRALEPAPAEQR